MNDIFKKRNPKLFIISQNTFKKNIKLNSFINKNEPNKLEYNHSPKISSLSTKKININDNINIKNINSFINKKKHIISYNKNNNNNSNSTIKKTKCNIIKKVYFPNENGHHNPIQIDTRNKIIDFNSNYRLKKFHSEKLTNSTDIIKKRIQYHDLDAQTRKTMKNFYSPLLNKNNDNNNTEKNIEEHSHADPYLTVFGVLFSNSCKNNNIKHLKKKPNNLIMTNSNFMQNKLWKKRIDKSIYPLSLPWLVRNKNNISEKSEISKSKGKTSFITDNEVSNIKKINEDNNKNNKFKKLYCYDKISIAGSDHGRTKINQDSFFIIPKIDDCDEIKIFGLFDGHGDNGHNLSIEIKNFFEEYFTNLFNNNNSDENNINFNDIKTEKNEDNKSNLFLNAINNFRNNRFSCTNNLTKSNLRDKLKNISPNYLNFTKKLKDRKIRFTFLEEKKDNPKSFIKLKIKSIKINNIYNQLISDNYSKIFSSHKKIDDLLHTKYLSNNFCYLSGSTSLLIFLINSKNCNKIISANLGDSKIISISEDKKIKELNIVHTPDNPDEKKRIINKGGVINRVDWSNIGPLRIWYKNKKYPGLSITRSFGDFESDELGVISEPHIKEYDIDEEKIKILVFGTDGVFKFLTNDKIMDIVWPYYENDDVNGATNKISEIAIKLWNFKNPKGISDVTVFVLFFK